MSGKKDKLVSKLPAPLPKSVKGSAMPQPFTPARSMKSVKGNLRTSSNVSTAPLVTASASPATGLQAPRSSLQPVSHAAQQAPAQQTTQPALQASPSKIATTAAPTLLSGNMPKENESTYDKTAIGVATGFSTSIYKKSPGAAQKQKTKSIYVPGQDIGPAGYVLASKGFRVLEKCGSGNYAKVYKIRSPDDKDYAVKIIDLSKTSKNYRVRFLPRELEILARLQHRSIVQIYEILQSSKMIFIFMEYTPNGTVADFLRQFRAIPEYVCKPMFSQIVEALHYMHSLWIAHRDLKLENILIDKYGQPKLTDFSYSLVCQKDEMGNLIPSRTFCGSLPYIPPEVLQEHEYDPRVADVWSIGVCLYVMLNDGLPFKFHDIASMLQCQLTKNWKFKARVATQISDVAKDLVTRMLEPDVKLRITCAEIVIHPWIWKSK